jgi:hypothetical protein
MFVTSCQCCAVSATAASSATVRMMSSDETSDYLNNLAGSGGNKDQSYLDSVNEKGGIVETPTEDYLNTLSTPGSGTGAANYLNDLTVNAGSK